MKSIKPGRGPSVMSGIGGIAAAIFGVIWMVGAASIGAPVFVSLFGVVFIILALVSVFYDFRNATSKNRMSAFDITAEGEEPDPLNTVFGSTDEKAPGISGNRFCPFCGTPVRDDYEFCNNCGKKLPE